MLVQKTIKKLEKVNKKTLTRFKKNFIKPARSETEVIPKPSKLLNEDEILLFESDMFFGVKEGAVYFDLSMLASFKYITSVEVRKDLSEKIMTVLLESKTQSSVSSWSNIAADFEESSHIELKSFAQSIREFGNKYEAFLKEFRNLQKKIDVQRKMAFLHMKQQSAAKRLLVLSSFPAFEMRYRMKKDEMKLTELCFNETFLKEIGHTIESFTSSVLVEGLPEIFPRTSSSAIKAKLSLFENYMVHETETPECETELLMKNGFKKKVALQTLTLVEIFEGDLIMSFIMYIKKKSVPFGTYQKQPHSSEFSKILKGIDEEKQFLFQSFYQENLQGFPINIDKVCGIRELLPETN